MESAQEPGLAERLFAALAAVLTATPMEGRIVKVTPKLPTGRVTLPWRISPDAKGWPRERFDEGEHETGRASTESCACDADFSLEGDLAGCGLEPSGGAEAVSVIVAKWQEGWPIDKLAGRRATVRETAWCRSEAADGCRGDR